MLVEIWTEFSVITRQREREFRGAHGAIRAPGTTRSRHRFIAEEIYFAVSKIRRFPCLRHGLKRESPEVFSTGGPGLIDTLWMTDQTADVCETRYSKGSQLVQSGAQ